MWLVLAAAVTLWLLVAETLWLGRDLIPRILRVTAWRLRVWRARALR